MFKISDDLLLAASQFSDWRLFPDDIHRCCALPTLTFESQPNLQNGRQRIWLKYDDFSEQLKSFVQQFLEHCCAQEADGESFAIDYSSDSGNKLKLRVQSLGGYFACRFIFTTPLDLDEIKGVTPAVRNLVLSSELGDRGGLVLFVGNSGTGKSVCAAAAMRHRLKMFGGHLVVVGDPPEQPIGDDGLSFVGASGFVDTVDICKIGYTKGLTKILRSYPAAIRPSLLFNEIRSDSNAFDLLNSALNGQVTFATMHASSPDAAIDRLISWCVKSGSDITLVRNMLSQCLFGITHHRIDLGSVRISAMPCTSETLQKIRDGYPLPIKATAPLKF